MNDGGEISRIRAEYARRDSDPRLGGLYDRLDPAVIYIRHEIERHMGLFFNARRMSSADAARSSLLDVGCGAGTFFDMFAQLGFSRDNMLGAELIAERIASRVRGPRNPYIVNADARRLPFRDSSFDFVSQFTVLSSVTDAGTRASIASEMRRVTRGGGYIVSYDMLHTNPFNPNLAPLKYSQLEGLFGAKPETAFRIVLNPLVLRRLVGRFRPLCDFLSALRIFNSFGLSFIRIDK